MPVEEGSPRFAQPGCKVEMMGIVGGVVLKYVVMGRAVRRAI